MEKSRLCAFNWIKAKTNKMMSKAFFMVYNLLTLRASKHLCYTKKS
jgi:hypothetical protein